jgi:hypothetical protein
MVHSMSALVYASLGLLSVRDMTHPVGLPEEPGSWSTEGDV